MIETIGLFWACCMIINLVFGDTADYVERKKASKYGDWKLRDDFKEAGRLIIFAPYFTYQLITE